MSYIPPPNRNRQQQHAIQQYGSSQLGPPQHGQYPMNSPYYQQGPHPSLPPAVNQHTNPHSNTHSPQVPSNSLPSHENNLFYQLQQATQSPNPTARSQPPPKPSQHRAPAPAPAPASAPILPPSRTGQRASSSANPVAHSNGKNNGQTQSHDAMQGIQQTIGQSQTNASDAVGSFSILNDDSPPPGILPNLTVDDMIPPPEGTYTTFDELMHHANQHAFSHGYALVIARSKRKGSHAYKKVLISCDRWGPVQHSGMRPEHLRKRNTTSKKTDCKFGFHAIETATEWKLLYRENPENVKHNHGPSHDMSKHAAARKLKPATMAAIKAYADAGLTVRETVEQIQITQPGAMIIPRDIYNARSLLKREPEKFPEVSPTELPPIVVRPNLSAEEKIRDECRAEVTKAKKETEDVRKELEALKLKLAEKDKVIKKFEMFIDICNERVMIQRERLNDPEGSGVVPAGLSIA